MKRKAFTLAEVLITLGLIGVVAAITMPTFVANTATAKIGPKLAKAVTSWENANKAYLYDHGVDSISSTGDYERNGADPSTYLDHLTDHLKGNVINVNNLRTLDNINYQIQQANDGESNTDVPHKNKIANLEININPRDNAVVGTDIFYFTLWDDGSLRPWGAFNFNGSGNNTAAGNVWTARCPNGGSIGSEARSYCAGSIFANDLKVRYKVSANDDNGQS